MKFRKVDKAEFTTNIIKKGTATRGYLITFSNSVINSGNSVSEVDWASRYKNVRAAANSIYAGIKRMDLPLIIITRGEHIYLMRKDATI